MGTDYFAQGEPPSPLRRYWSLAVEEQFYLVWPFLLVLCLVWMHRRSDSRDGPSCAVRPAPSSPSSYCSRWPGRRGPPTPPPVTAYFSTFARAWELGIGAAGALLPRGLRLTAPARNALGLGAIGASTLLLSEATPSQVRRRCCPSSGCGVDRRRRGTAPTLVDRVLTAGPLVVIGDWSYSSYLWHWPVIVLVRTNLGPDRFGSITVRLLTGRRRRGRDPAFAPERGAFQGRRHGQATRADHDVR